MFLIIVCFGLSHNISLKMRKAYLQQNMLLDMCLRTTFVDKFCIVCQNLRICKSFCFRTIQPLHINRTHLTFIGKNLFYKNKFNLFILLDVISCEVVYDQITKYHLSSLVLLRSESRAACAQSFAPWQQATIEITRRDHSIIACSRHIDIFLFFEHIPFVVNHTINLTPPERLQQYYICQ